MNAPQFSSTSRVSRFRERLEHIANGLAVVLGAISLVAALAFWLWYAFGPKPIHIPPTPNESPTAVLRATLIFGDSPVAVPIGKVEEGVPATGALRLVGVIAEDDGEGGGYAVFHTGEVFQVGDNVPQKGPLIGTLTRVEPNAIVLREPSGAERRITLRSEKAIDADEATGVVAATEKVEDPPPTKARTSARAPAVASKTSLMSPAAASSPASMCRPAGYRGQMVPLNTELLQGALQQPETFYALLEAKEGGLVVKADGGHAAMLGLRAGDLLQSANGIALSRVEDISSAMLRPLASGQSVLLKGKRGEAPRELLLVNVSACSE